jgi:MoaA/NifB/PqqE/SkfB family radical SAM enzyme
MYVTLNDNFTLMTAKTARRFVDLEVDQIFLSLDGATKETFERIRVGADFDKVIFNTRQLIQIKGEMGSRKPEVKINTVVCSTNYHELPALVEVTHDLGIGMIQFVNAITFENTENLDTKRFKQPVQAKISEALERARQLGVLVKIELFDRFPVQQCSLPWKRNFVTYDGYVHPCCYTTQTGDRQAHNRRSFGNLAERSHEEIWGGEAYSAFRKNMQQGILPKVCEHCPKYVGKPDSQPE